MLKLSYKILETSIISKYNLKSTENYEHIKIFEANLLNIGKAYNIINNTSEIFQINNLPSLKELYLSSHLDFEDIIRLRYKPNAKHFRTWINTINNSCDATNITKEYINELTNSNSFFESGAGKFLRTAVMFTVGTVLGSSIADPLGSAAGLGLSMLDTFWIESILKRKNPSMLIEDIKLEIEKKKYEDLIH